ncbi:MAG: hypothetical protein D3916_17565, partial [Candidatus Electrothrix sp. MAN1_4]|nr:hypothetical protein [Candidatus Electrothrix sp. MAN1_4]
MNPVQIRKINGVPYQYHNGHEDKADALAEKKALIIEGYQPRMMKDQVYNFYHIYVKLNKDLSEIPPEPVPDHNPQSALDSLAKDYPAFQYNS